MTFYSENNLNKMLCLLISITFGLLHCSSDHAPKQQTTSTPQSLDTLQNKLDAQAAEALIGYFLDSEGNDVDDNFFFDGKMEEKDKAVSFRLNPKQTADFFKELDDLEKKTPSQDSVCLRIRMAFIGNNGHKLKGGINLVPLLELIVNDKNPNGNFYPLRAFKSDLPAMFDSLPKHIVNNQIPISEAKKLIENWNKIPVNDVTEQLYFDNKKGISGGRIKYYTFDKADTKAIYQYQTKLANNKKTCYFHIYLGQLQEREYVALRTIIHLDDNPNNNQATVNNEPPYFEFAKPCPNYCHE
jgi:hypothetical protein